MGVREEQEQGEKAAQWDQLVLIKRWATYSVEHHSCADSCPVSDMEGTLRKRLDSRVCRALQSHFLRPPPCSPARGVCLCVLEISRGGATPLPLGILCGQEVLLESGRNPDGAACVHFL